MRHGKILFVAATLTFLFAMVMNALAEDCPPGAPSCKVVIMTPQEEQTLIAPNGIFDNAEWANRSGLAGIVAAWKQKLATSPAGTVKKPEPVPTPPVKK